MRYNVEAVEKVSEQIPGRDAEKVTHRMHHNQQSHDCEGSRETPKYIDFTRQKDFSYRLVR
jgi:hypothetical protein